jgi:hypothetical protein
MKRQRPCARPALATLSLIAALARAGAEEAPVVSPPSKETVSLQGFALQNPLCVEWSDGCSICLLDATDSPRCSTPGIACQSASIECRREKAK